MRKQQSSNPERYIQMMHNIIRMGGQTLQKVATGAEYILTFSSFYKAMYAKEILQSSGIYANLRKIPPELIHSCGQGLYIDTADFARAMETLTANYAAPTAVFQIAFVRGREDYRRIH